MNSCTKEVTLPNLHQPLHSKVANYLIDQRRNGQFCDLIISQETGDFQMFGHFCVVGAQSKLISGSHFMQKSLQFSIQNPLKVTIANFDCTHCLTTMMDFFYEDMVSITKEHAPHFRDLAKKLMVIELNKIFETKSECEISTNETKIDFNSTYVYNNEQTACNDVKLALQDTFEDRRNYFKLQNPRASNSNSKINYCIGCDFKCYRVYEMISHMGNCEPSHLICSLCEVGFLGWRDYDLHLKKHNADLKKPFFCLECEARFVTRAAMSLHQPKHSSETPHECTYCGKRFKWRQGLNSHLLIHNAEKQMLCDVCGYSTTHKKALNSHKLTHTGEYFKCTFPGCTHRSNRKENLKMHIETHNKAQHFVCEVCGCKFSQSKNLKRHALKHTDSPDALKKYKCQLCAFSSHRSDKLKEHMERVHTEKVIQLELPETVDNAFDSSVENSFDLPTIIPFEKAVVEELTKPKIKRIKSTRLKNELKKHKLKTIAPKLLSNILENELT